MPDGLWYDLGGRGFTALLGLVAGGFGAWIYGYWKRYREHQHILHGDARDTIVIHHHLIESAEMADEETGESRRVPKVLRIRAIGQSEMNRVVPNGYLASILLKRSFEASSQRTLISMEGPEGSYLLETLMNFVCDRTSNAPFEHDRYVMTACCEPASLAQHQPITILLVAVADLELFESWPDARAIHVEHGSEGMRILTLREMARRFRDEQEQITKLREVGQRTRFVETMYVLDMALDRRCAPLPTKSVPWGRFEAILRERDLE